MKDVIFITGNEHKFEEFCKWIHSVKLKRKNINLPELQGLPEEIAKEKAKLACSILKKPCFVDDTSLVFKSWKSLPGPYIKYFLQELGVKKLSRLLHETGNDYRATAITVIGYCEPNKHPEAISGKTQGRIVKPTGPQNFGYDSIFKPNNSNKTQAQMTKEEKSKHSCRMKAIKKFESFLKQKRNARSRISRKGAKKGLNKRKP
ncbi:non-canonical purine NTP pyrophosphatase [Candidatus Woesearchaeota archaeon]|nr:non-canonical purine NTP pyrophosphatase [Candidatus Woesearchaeota archaeon]